MIGTGRTAHMVQVVRTVQHLKLGFLVKEKKKEEMEWKNICKLRTKFIVLFRGVFLFSFFYFLFFSLFIFCRNCGDRLMVFRILFFDRGNLTFDARFGFHECSRDGCAGTV